MHGFSYGKGGVTRVLSPEQEQYNREADEAWQQYVSEVNTADQAVNRSGLHRAPHNRRYCKICSNAKEVYLDTIYNLRDRLGVKESTSLAG